MGQCAATSSKWSSEFCLSVLRNVPSSWDEDEEGHKAWEALCIKL